MKRDFMDRPTRAEGPLGYLWFRTRVEESQILWRDPDIEGLLSTPISSLAFCDFVPRLRVAERISKVCLSCSSPCALKSRESGEAKFLEHSSPSQAG